MARIEKLEIGSQRLCDCRSNHLNCMTAKDWSRSQVGLWEFYYTKEDIRDKDIHPATYPLSLPAKCIELFTHRGELVLDPFVGSGSTLLAARGLRRNAVGFDLNCDYIELSNSRLKESASNHDTQQIAICDDALNIPKYFEEETISLCVTSPPYANILTRARLNKSIRAEQRKNKHYKQVQQYSDDPRDLGTMAHDEYREKLTDIYRGLLPLLKPRGNCIINVNDVWWENKRYPTHIYVYHALEKAGFELRNILIWDKRNLVNNVGIFGWPNNFIKMSVTFEYIMHFWKPE